jgi:hypothetical protein
VLPIHPCYEVVDDWFDVDKPLWPDEKEIVEIGY